jgi:hypothetical protein
LAPSRRLDQFRADEQLTGQNASAQGALSAAVATTGFIQQFSFKNMPGKLRSGPPATGVEGFPKPVARWTLDRV